MSGSPVPGPDGIDFLIPPSTSILMDNLLETYSSAPISPVISVESDEPYESDIKAMRAKIGASDTDVWKRKVVDALFGAIGFTKNIHTRSARLE